MEFKYIENGDDKGFIVIETMGDFKDFLDSHKDVEITMCAYPDIPTIFYYTEEYINETAIEL